MRLTPYKLEYEINKQGLIRGPWRWLDNTALMGDHGNRPVVLAAGEEHRLVPYIAERDASGCLVPIDPKGLLGRLIEAVPDLLNICCRLADLHDCIEDPPAAIQVAEDAYDLLERIAAVQVDCS